MGEDDKEIEWCQTCSSEVVAGAEDEELEKISLVTPTQSVRLPSSAEIEQHHLTHLLFKDCCTFCV